MLTIHIFAGSFLLLFGIAALSLKKGLTKHRLSGNLFFMCLLVLTITAMFISDDPTMPLLTLYYGSTAWAIVLRKENSTGIFEILAMLVIVFVSAKLFYFVFTATDLNPTFKFIFLIHATVAALSAFLDLNMIIRGGLAGKHRMARHAWRTCYALLGAVMSFSANTSDYWPDFINSNILIYLTIAVLFYWLIRILFTKFHIKLAKTLSRSLLIKTVFDR